MKEFAIALILGSAAGLLDVLPMIKKPIPKSSKWMIFAQWVLIGLAICFIEWRIDPWIKGLIIAECGIIPVAILATYRNPKSVPGIFAFAAPLGMAIAVVFDMLV